MSASVPAPRRLSLELLQDSPRWCAAVGVVVAVGIIAAVLAIVAAFTGRLTNETTIDARLPSSGSALPGGTVVEYRGVTVGKVLSERMGADGVVSARLAFYPAKLREVPRGVRALVAPLSIFGNQYVQLVPPASGATEQLSAGDLIEADNSTPSSSLQGTVAQLSGLLDAIRPADLDTALSAAAQALRGQGDALGRTLRATSQYLAAINPSLATLPHDLQLIAPVLAQADASAPSLLDLVANASHTATTVTAEAAPLHRLLGQATTVSAQTEALLAAVTSSLPTLLNDAGPLLGDVSANPQELSQTLDGLGRWAGAWAAAESHGPFLTLSADLPIADVNAAVQAAVGYDAAANVAAGLGAAVNPPTYTPADCPVFPGQPNPYCGHGGSPAAAAIPASPGPAQPGAGPTAAAVPATAGGPATVGAGTAQARQPDAAVMAAAQKVARTDDTTTAQQDAVIMVARALGHGRVPNQALAAVLLTPLFASMSAGSR
ncbi:MCE family protein [Acidiferrimicrobium sp. IK]|uniref:MCE family protein n=1 Tax=Acidiferrimicrobium sp. IK TaxID=2871700 RepID=UPI0021CB0A0F|nr:MCE family protein [Acidiferrimicrobium sp. IK]MCU4184610.1 MCE family protein [Acidiferrimicrobium sp. IK]